MNDDIRKGAAELAELAQEMFDIMRELGMQTLTLEEEQVPHGQIPFRIVCFNIESREEAEFAFDQPFPTN